MTLPSPNTVRTVAVVILIGIGLIHFLTLPQGFKIAGYLGVALILAIGLALAGAYALLHEDQVGDQAGVWWYALCQGVLNSLGYLLSRTAGLPLVSHRVSADWDSGLSMSLFYCGMLLTALSTWVLAVRWSRRRRGTPVASARDRDRLGGR